MLTKQGVALTFYAFYVASKTGKTGLTVTLDIYETTSGSPIVTAASATELGGGLYYYTLASGSVDASGAYVAVFKTADSSVDQQHIPAIWITDTVLKNLDVAVSTRNATTPLDSTATQAAAAAALAAYDPPTKAELDAGLAGVTAPTAAAVADAVWDEALTDHLTAGTTGAQLNAAGAAGDPLLNSVPGSYTQGTAGFALGRVGRGTISTVSPTSASGDVTIDMGYDYDADDGLALEWTDDDGTWVDLTGCEAVLIIAGLLEADCTILNAGTSAQGIRCELTAAQTGTLKPGRRAFVVDVTRAGRLIKQISGTATITAKVTA